LPWRKREKKTKTTELVSNDELIPREEKNPLFVGETTPKKQQDQKKKTGLNRGEGAKKTDPCISQNKKKRTTKREKGKK